MQFLQMKNNAPRYGKNAHHCIEGMFKALAQALCKAVQLDEGAIDAGTRCLPVGDEGCERLAPGPGGILIFPKHRP